MAQHSGRSLGRHCPRARRCQGHHPEAWGCSYEIFTSASCSSVAVVTSSGPQSDRTGNDWQDVVLPVLQEMHAAEQEDRKSRAQELLVELSGSSVRGQMTARRIRDAGLATGISITAVDYSINRGALTAEGMRAIGQWSDTALRGALLAALCQRSHLPPVATGGGSRWFSGASPTPWGTRLSNRRPRSSLRPARPVQQRGPSGGRGSRSASTTC